MARYIPCDPKQSAIRVINHEDQLQPDTFEHALHYLVEHRLDLSVFGPRYRNDGTGRPAFAPAILVWIALVAVICLGVVKDMRKPSRLRASIDADA